MSEAAEATRRRAASWGAAPRGRVRIGISGWRYPGWRGSFYPAGPRQADELSCASRHFDTVEITGTHYSLQRPEFFARRHDETPDHFVFAVKGSKSITHMKQLRDIHPHRGLERRRRAERREADRPGNPPAAAAARRLCVFRQRRQGSRPVRRAGAAPQAVRKLIAPLVNGRMSQVNCHPAKAGMTIIRDRPATADRRTRSSSASCPSRAA